jgi:hypothetical protein
MSLMFMSYRRKDTAQIARRVYDVLEKEFGGGSVFIDIDTIAGGEDFLVRLEGALKQCHVLLALIGPRWMEGKRLHNHDDFVRLEIERAISRGLPVVPLLINDANMPSVDELPPSIAPLTQQQAISINSGQGFSGQMDRLVRDLKRLLGTRVSSGKPLLHAEMVRLQSIINDDIADLCFTLVPTTGTPFDDFGFRISTAKHGSFFCFTSQGNLIISDRAGNVIQSYAAIGSSLEKEHSFYSIDLQAGKKAIPQHALVHLRLGDLETASFDFMAKPGALPLSDMCYAVSVTAVVSNWFVNCGSFSLKNPDRGFALPVFKEFVSASPFAETFELRVLSQHHSASAGQDLESNALDKMLAIIQARAERNQNIREMVRLPSSTAPLYRVPVSFRFALDVNGLVEQLGYGEMGDATVLVHKLFSQDISGNEESLIRSDAPQTTQITALLQMTSLRDLLTNQTPKAPPPQLQVLVGWMLSNWTFLDKQGRAQFTELPLTRVVALCPVEHGTWLWLLEGSLHSNWEPEWVAVQSERLSVSTVGIKTLHSCTEEWILVPVHPENSI